MATRSYIGIRNTDDSVEYIYCHFDGYPSHNGKILVEHYNELDKVKALIALGDLSRLGKEIGSKQNFNDYSSQNQDWCLAYSRDRGENNTSARSDRFSHVVKDDNVDYAYIFSDGKWECYDTYAPESNFNLYSMG